MSEGSMTRAEREAFLSEVHVGVLGIDEPANGPLLSPIWYAYEDGAIHVNIGRTSRKAQLAERAGRASMTVQTETAPYQYVTVEGPAQLRAGWHDPLAMAVRYLGPELGPWYVDNNPETDDSVTLVLVPERWRTYDFNKLFA
jgi:nitroimidazol reductase NimA-like FMN-containing flavoprotein (pyridoxamine 5'-phosphate oxidase superfamily)